MGIHKYDYMYCVHARNTSLAAALLSRADRVRTEKFK